MAHIRQSKPGSGLVFQANSLAKFSHIPGFRVGVRGEVGVGGGQLRVSQANMAHIRQSRPDSVLDIQAETLEMFKNVPRQIPAGACEAKWELVTLNPEP